MIKNLIFDFGNVLLTLDEPKTWNAFKELLDPTKIDDLFKEVMDPFERGEISEEAFFNRLQRRSKVVLNGDVYIDAWNSMYLEGFRNKMAFPILQKYYLIRLFFRTKCK